MIIGDVEETAQRIYKMSEELGVPLGRGAWVHVTQSEDGDKIEYACAVGIVALSERKDESPNAIDCSIATRPGDLGLSASQLWGLSDGFEDEVPDPSHDDMGEYAQAYAVGHRVAELAGEPLVDNPK